MLVKYLPSIYLEGIDENLKMYKILPKFFQKILLVMLMVGEAMIILNFILAACIKNKTKYFEVQHNGTYFVFDNNVHFDISSLFRDKFIGWGLACKGFKHLAPFHHFVNKTKKKK